MNVKKRAAVVLFAICLLSLMAFGTLAFYNATDIAENIITTGNVDVGVLQDGDSSSSVQRIMPGDIVNETTCVQNTGDHPVWVCVNLAFSIVGNDGLDLSVISVDINKEYWDEIGGMYYYKIPLEPGEVSEPLFSTVVFDGPGMDNRYAGCEFDLLIKAYAVQSENNGDTVTEAAGWPEI